LLVVIVEVAAKKLTITKTTGINLKIKLIVLFDFINYLILEQEEDLQIQFESSTYQKVISYLMAFSKTKKIIINFLENK